MSCSSLCGAVRALLAKAGAVGFGSSCRSKVSRHAHRSAAALGRLSARRRELTGRVPESLAKLYGVLGRWERSGRAVGVTWGRNSSRQILAPTDRSPFSSGRGRANRTQQPSLAQSSARAQQSNSRKVGDRRIELGRVAQYTPGAFSVDRGLVGRGRGRSSAHPRIRFRRSRRTPSWFQRCRQTRQTDDANF